MKSLVELRQGINAIDEEMLLLLAKRVELVKAVGEEKKKLKIPIQDVKREEELLNTLTRKGERLGLSRDIIEEIWMTFFRISYIIEK